VTRALRSLAGVEDVAVNLGERTATVTHNGADLEAMKEAVDDAGYEVVGAQ
jgi:copper chaperone CopZ